MRKTSKTGIELIKRFEGCRLTAYLCPAKNGQSAMAIQDM